MADASSEKWPSYAVGSDKHIHALGVVAINYNRLEMALDRLLYMYLGASREPYCYVFNALNDPSRQALYKLCVNKEEADHALRDHLIYFVECFRVCAQNRNILLHSNVDDEKSTDEIIALAKAPRDKPHLTNEMAFSLTQLRRTADEMWAIFSYAAELFRFIRIREREEDRAIFADPQPPPPPSLPDKPDPPTSLAEKHQSTH